MINFAIGICAGLTIWQFFVSKLWFIWPIMIVVLLVIKFTKWGQ